MTFKSRIKAHLTEAVAFQNGERVKLQSSEAYPNATGEVRGHDNGMHKVKLDGSDIETWVHHKELAKEDLLDEETQLLEARIAVKRGAFHRWLGKSPNEKITAADIAKGKAAGGHAAKMATFAQNFGHVK